MQSDVNSWRPGRLNDPVQGAALVAPYARSKKPERLATRSYSAQFSTRNPSTRTNPRSLFFTEDLSSPGMRGDPSIICIVSVRDPFRDHSRLISPTGPQLIRLTNSAWREVPVL